MVRPGPQRPTNRSVLGALLIAAVTGAATPSRAADQLDVAGALRWLVDKQASDGSWGNRDKLALTGMAGLALLSGGSTPTRGPYARNVRLAIEFVMACQRQGDGKAFTHASSGYSAIHNHGYALLFLTQAYGEAGNDQDERMKLAIKQGILATCDAQYPSGGFGYFLDRSRIPREHSNMWREDEASTTISQIQALRGARNAGFTIERDALNRAAAYIARSQHKETGGFVYSIGSPRVSFIEGDDRPTFAITAACTAVLHALGTYEGPVIERGISYLEAFIPPARRKTPFFYYAHYYAAQVMHLVGGPRGERWMKAVKAELTARQRADGSWPADPEDSLATGDSEILNTAWSLQVVQIDSGTLPMHER